MRDETVAKNYAETLFELAQKHNQEDEFEVGIQSIAALIQENPDIREFIETPRISSGEKKRALEKALGGRVPVLLVNFLKVVIEKRRQRLLRMIAVQFHALVDEHAGRTHVEVTVARPMESDQLDEVANALSAALGKTVIPHLQVNPDILGGIVVRTGDTVYDGSIKRQIERMRRTLLLAELPALAGE